jgi:hypothetical protein
MRHKWQLMGLVARGFVKTVNVYAKGGTPGQCITLLIYKSRPAITRRHASILGSRSI